MLASTVINSPGSSDSVLVVWASIAVAVVGIATFARQLIRWLKEDGKRDATLDALPGEMKKLQESNKRREESSRKLEGEVAAIKEATSANGLNTDQVGDIAKRTEAMVRDIGSKLDQHIGENATEHRAFERTLEAHAVELRNLGRSS